MNRPLSTIALGTAILAAAALPAFAQNAGQDAGQEAGQEAGQKPAVKAGRYAVEPGHTQVIFSVSHFGFTYYSGLFSGASGSLKLDPANPAAAQLKVTISVASVITTSKVLDKELRSPQFLDAARYPNATFVSTRITPTGPDSARIEGQLTLHGVTRPETLTARFVGAGVNPLDKQSTIGFSATGTIERSEFDVKAYIPAVGDAVRLTIAGAFVRQR